MKPIWAFPALVASGSDMFSTFSTEPVFKIATNFVKAS